MLKKQLPYFIFVFLLPVVVMLWWWGLFSAATVAEVSSGGFDYIYLEAKGPYSKLADKQKEILALMKAQNISPGAEVTLMISDPRTTPYKERLARTGFVVSAGTQPKLPLQLAHVAKRQVITSTIKAHPLFAYGKTYAALLDYLSAHQLQFKLPTLEIYDKSVLRVEMELNP